MNKDPPEMSEEEIRLAREFEKKEEAFLEEREKLKKALEAELRKLQASITQGMEQFDERLQKLFQLKIRTQMVIHQDELKILHLARSLIIEQEVGMKIQQFNDLLQEKKVMKVGLLHQVFISGSLFPLCTTLFSSLARKKINQQTANPIIP